MIISVIIPVYNVEKYLQECLESVLNQSEVELQILLINDGSTDSSGEISRSYEKKYANIQLITTENRGLSEARNTGIDHAIGDYLIFLDSDDYWESDFLKDLAMYLEENEKLEYVFFRCKYYYQVKNLKQEQHFPIKREEIQKRTGAECLDYMLKEMKQFQWMAVLGIVKRTFLLKHGLYFEKDRSYEDTLWTPEVFLHATHLDYYDASVYIYRLEREGQITAHFSYRGFADNVYISSMWYEKLKDYPIAAELKQKLMYNLSSRYFFAIWFGGFLNKEEKVKMLPLLEKNKFLFHYNAGIVRKMTAFFCRVAGFKATISLFKSMVQMKRLIYRKRWLMKT